MKEEGNAHEEKYVFMLDVSGSVGGSQHYYNTIEQLVSLYGQQVEKYYYWDTSIEEVGKKGIEAAIKQRLGRGGTSPELVAQEVVKKGYKKLILITDGQVSDHSVQMCDKLLEQHVFTKTICYIISTSRYEGLNMSVTCPFTRKCDNEVYEKYTDKPFKKLVQFTPEDYKILDTLDEITLENFMESYDKIEGLIIALNMGKEGNIPLKNQLVIMKNRVNKELSKKNSKKNLSELIREDLEKGDLEEALSKAKKVAEKYLQDDMTTEMGKKINHLISLCGDLRGKYDLNQIKSNKMGHAEDVKEGELEQQVALAQLSKNPIECPIILDEDVPQILIDDCQPLLVGVEKPIVDDITTCPLRLLNYPEIKNKLKSRLSNFMGVKYADKFFKNPFTQNKLLGAIPLGCHKSHVKVGNHTIAKLVSDGKLLGNLDLFYAVIWIIIKEKQIEYLKDIEKNATEHLIHRLTTSRTMASLCGLPQLVSVQLNTDIAVWYCVNSFILKKEPNRDTFRFHTYSMDSLIEIVKILNYPYHQAAESHLARTKGLLEAYAVQKRMTEDKKANLKQAIKCLTQNCVEIKLKNIGADVEKTEKLVQFVPIDGKAEKEKIEAILSMLPKDLRKLPVEEIVAIFDLVDTKKTACDIQIDYDFAPKELGDGFINWGYGVKDYGKEPLNICPETLRPISEGKSGVEAAREFYGLKTEELFNSRKQFLSFLQKFKRMPTKDELVLFYYNRYIVHGKKTTLPYQTEQWASDLIKEYSMVIEKEKLPMNEVVARISNNKKEAKVLPNN